MEISQQFHGGVRSLTLGQVGDHVLIEAGKWTTGFYVDGVRYWKTDDEVVLALGDEPTTTY